MASRIKKYVLLTLVLAALLLTGCGRSDVVLTANEDGSFKANVNYGITKALMGNEEVKEQVKALITDSLDQNDIPYTESETDDLVIISVEKEFKDINELTSAEAWGGVRFVPAFSQQQSDGKLWIRFEGGRLKIDGVLDADVFSASQLVNQNDMASSFGGSLTVVLPSEAQEYGDAQAEGVTYKWDGTAVDSKKISLVSSKYLKTADATSEKSPVKLAVAALAVVAVLVAVLIVIRRKKK